MSPAFDINPSTYKSGLSLNIDIYDNSLDFELAKSVGVYFRLTHSQMNGILEQVKKAVKNWQLEANIIGIKKSEIELMYTAFKV